MLNELDQLTEKNDNLLRNISVLEGKKDELFKKKNELSDNFLNRIFQRRKIRELEGEIVKVLNQQENYRFEMQGNKLDIDSLKIHEELDMNIDEAKAKLEEQGLHISDTMFSPKKIIHSNDVTLEIDARCRKDYDHIPTAEEIINLAKENNIITQISDSDLKKLYSEMNKVNFSIDENPNSYETNVYDIYEKNNTLYLPIHDDTDAPFATLVYDGKDNKWKNDHYSLSVDNPIESIKNRYSELSLNKSTTERLSQVLNTIDLPDLSVDKDPIERQQLIEETLIKFNSAQINFIDAKFDKEELDLFVSASETGIAETNAEISFVESQLQSTAKLEKDRDKTYSELEALGDMPGSMNNEINKLEEMMTTKEKDQANYVLFNVEEFEFKNALKSIEKLPENVLTNIVKEKAQENKDHLENSFEANYQKFLVNGNISKKEKTEIMLFDNSQTSFDKVSKRLEVLEKVKKENPEKDLTQKDKELSAIRGNENMMSKILSREYMQMDSKVIVDMDLKAATQNRQHMFDALKQQQGIDR